MLSCGMLDLTAIPPNTSGGHYAILQRMVSEWQSQEHYTASLFAALYRIYVAPALSLPCTAA